MIRQSQHTSITRLFGFILMTCFSLHQGMSQGTSPQQPQPSVGLSQFRAVPLAHLYWHFLMYQNHLDTKAEELTAQGKDGSVMHDYLQKKMRLSDADFAPIRTSSVRLTAKIKTLDAQAVAIRATGMTPSSHDQLKTLTAQREANIAAEISYLRQELPPDKINAFETFLTQFFSLANAVPRTSSSPGQLVAPAVQR
jgi:hypothetical protein